jgi:hypothetical protein
MRKSKSLAEMVVIQRLDFLISEFKLFWVIQIWILIELWRIV